MLAVLRPVFRGLRQQPFPEVARDAHHLPPCSAETRFQGIATGSSPIPIRSTHSCPCSAETRFQGIATWRKPPFRRRGWITTLAVLRPVFRGLRRGGRGGGSGGAGISGSPCSAETRFQGIATTPWGPPQFPKGNPCSAETRFQGIATSEQLPPGGGAP